MSGIERARTLLLDAVTRRIFPGAAVDAGASRGTLWREDFGTLTFPNQSSPADPIPRPVQPTTPFDLASLTKVIATTTIVMELVRIGALRLDEPVAELFQEWRGADRAAVTVRDLLEHASGLPARLLSRPPSTAREFEHEICTTPLEYAPRQRSVYSDLGFILLGFLASARGGRSLDAQFADLVTRLASVEPPLASEPLLFKPGGGTKALAAPTLPQESDVRRGRTLTGEVHDSYAHLLGGIAGHTGLFATTAAVAAFARPVLRAARGEEMPPPFSAQLVAQFVQKTAVPGSSRARGWDTMLPTSSCGELMSPAAIGHVGYTGTSLWIDPARDRYYVLLTNRACRAFEPTELQMSLDEIRAVRRAFHDALHEL